MIPNGMNGETNASANSEPPVDSDNSWIKGFGEYIADIRTLSGLLSKGIFIAPIIVGLLLAIGPPWPDATGVSLLTTVAEVVISIYIFHRAMSTKDFDFDRSLSTTLKFIIVFGILYLALFVFFVRDMPDSAHRDVKGIYYTVQAAKAISTSYPEDEALRGAGYKPTLIWAPWTVYVMRLLLVLVWIAFFCSLSAYIALFVLKQRTSKQVA